MPASIYCTDHAARGRDDLPCAPGELWHAGHGTKLVYFLGFDNAYFWGVTHLALLMAHEGRYVLPDTIVCNEFYELDNEKFSTSRGHVVWSHELVAEVPRDLVRFHLALTAPEHQRTNFSRDALESIARQRLVDPWDRLAGLLAVDGAGGPPLPVSEAARARARTMVARFSACYELRGYSLPRAADLLVAHLERLERRAARSGARGDLFLEVAALVACASPILIDVAEAAAHAGAPVRSLSSEAFDVARIAPFALPRLAAAAPPVPLAARAAGR
jgi:methionyl-tRNA synthetase